MSRRWSFCSRWSPSPQAKAAAPITAVLGQPASTQAGKHANVGARVGFSDISQIDPCDCHVVKDVYVETPAGVVGNPHNIPTCEQADLASGKCPVDSQVGLMVIHFYQQPEFHDGAVIPLYNVEAPPNRLALFAFPVPLSASNSVYINVDVRTESDYGLEFHTFGIPRLLPSAGFTQLNWGVPGDPINDKVRFGLSASKEASCPGTFPGHHHPAARRTVALHHRRPAGAEQRRPGALAQQPDQLQRAADDLGQSRRL